MANGVDFGSDNKASIGRDVVGRDTARQDVTVNLGQSSIAASDATSRPITLGGKVDRLLQIIDGAPELDIVGVRRRVFNIENQLRYITWIVAVESVLGILIFAALLLRMWN